MLRVTGRLVSLPPLPITAVTPVPENVSAVAPFSVLPAMVAEKDVPGFPEAGEMDVIDGPLTLDATTEKVTALLVPPAVVTVTLRTPDVADAAIENEVVRDVALVTFTPPTATPVPLTVTVVAPFTKLEPANAT
jgi:hypothetical protein